jgi:hypothetical protein
MNNFEDYSALEVMHDAERHRFQLTVDGQMCALDYSRSPGKMVIYHTEVPQQIEGQGLAAHMTRAALEFARTENLRVVPRCSYAAAFFRKNPQYADLLATE